MKEWKNRSNSNDKRKHNKTNKQTLQGKKDEEWCQYQLLVVVVVPSAAAAAAAVGWIIIIIIKTILKRFMTNQKDYMWRYFVDIKIKYNPIIGGIQFLII